MMLTREQIEGFKKSGCVMWAEDFDDICDMALNWLAVQPRPIEEAPKGGKFIGFLEDGRACTMSWRQHVKNWKQIEGGGHAPDGYHWLTCEEDHDSYVPRKALAWMPFPHLTALPEPTA